MKTTALLLLTLLLGACGKPAWHAEQLLQGMALRGQEPMGGMQMHLQCRNGRLMLWLSERVLGGTLHIDHGQDLRFEASYGRIDRVENGIPALLNAMQKGRTLRIAARTENRKGKYGILTRIHDIPLRGFRGAFPALQRQCKPGA